LRAPPQKLKTPPYVTANPVVTHTKLDSPGLLRFIVLATDGLWDELSSEQVVSLVSAHLSGVRGVVPKASLKATRPGDKPNIQKLDQKVDNSGDWIFKDENLASHLIRNAFGGPGASENKLQRLLSIPAPYSRRYRDDTTAIVIWWGDQDAVKAKL